MIVVIYSQQHRRSLSRVSCLPGEVGVCCWLAAAAAVVGLLLRPACVSFNLILSTISAARQNFIKMSYRGGRGRGGNFRGWGQGRWVLQKLNIEWSFSVSFLVKLLSSNPIMFVLCRYSQPPIDPALRIGFVQLMLDAGITSTMTWGEAQSLLENDARFLAVHFRQRTFLFNEFQR